MRSTPGSEFLEKELRTLVHHNFDEHEHAW
jgi:hypothetical protein